MTKLNRVSFKTAKAIKEAGYPQEGDAYSTYYDEEHKETFVPFVCNRNCDYIAPYVMEVWLWLWREKKIKISAEIWHDKPNNWGSIIEGDTFYKELYGYNDPEEAIIAAIEYLVENNLIK